jgi:tetratricopeptide (TPR) repeat protein
MYPEKDERFWNNLALYYGNMGQHEKALECQLREAALPFGKTAFGRNLLALRYKNLGRFSEAKATLETAISEGIENTELHQTLYVLAFLEGDEAAIQRHGDWVETHPDDFGGMEWARINAAYISGRLQKARQLAGNYVLSLQQQNRDEIAANWLARDAWWESVTGCSEQAQLYARKALEIAPSGRFPRRFAAWALAATGATEEAEQIAATVSEEYPQSTLWHGWELPTVEANIELWNGNPETAVELLRSAKRFEVSGRACIYTRGRAFLALKQGEEAAAEFQKILDHRGITGMSMAFPAAIVGLARSKVLMGDEAGARKSYEEFLEMWKDADPDVPLLQEAKAEYEKLQL